MTELDDNITRDLEEAYGINVGFRVNNGKNGYWKYCVTCLKMQNHKEQNIVGIMEWVCQICQRGPAPTEKPIFRLVRRPTK